MHSEECYLEHANLTVRSLDEAVRFITTAFPHFRVRGRGISMGTPWLHVGTDEVYVAFFEAPDSQPEGASDEGLGFNHVGFVVSDADAVAAALRDSGFKEGFVAEPHPHRKRVYYHDGDGNEWEFVQYLSDDPSKRNDYSS